MVSASLAYTLLIGAFIIFDLLPIFHQKKWKVFWIYVLLTAFAYISSILYFSGIELPSPAGWIKKLVESIWGLKG